MKLLKVKINSTGALFMVYKDPSQNFIYEYQHPLESIFLPKSIAVVGAKDTTGSVGRTIMMNLLSGGFKGCIVGVNPKRTEVLGAPCYPSLLDIPQDIDLAVIVVPAKYVPQVMQECGEKKVKGVIIISAGFKELGPEGLLLERSVLHIAQQSGIRIIGPNCLGIMNPGFGLNASFAKGMALQGSLAFISQSGAMCTSVLDWSFQARIGFSAFVSIGSMADVDWGDLIEYFGQDSQTKAILMYMETVGDPSSFMSYAREVALDKPIIVIKPGKSKEAQKAAASHTGSLSGSDDVFDAACERAGVLRVASISQLFGMAEVLARQPKPKGPRLAIVTNAGGPSVLATDSVVENGAKIAPLSQDTLQKLNEFLPDAWSHSNPIDILGDASPERYEKTIQEVFKDPSVDGVLAVLSPQDMTDAQGTSEALRPYANHMGKPLLASWMGGLSVQKGRSILHENNIPSFEYPDDAAWSFATMWRYSQLVQGLYETPLSEIEKLEERKEIRHKASELIQSIQKSGRELLTEEESKRLFQLYGIPVVQTCKASSAQDAIQAANTIGYPVVVKLHSETITHKSDIGGVQLNLRNEEAVEAAFRLIKTNVTAKYGEKAFQGVTVQKMIKTSGVELIVGSSIDPQFGPVILFGAGGIYVEVMKDRALGLPPLNSTLALHMMNKTKIVHALGEFRGKKGVSPEKVANVLVRFSEMVIENPEIIESDINPLLATEDGVIALDARCVIAPSGASYPTVKPAIRPYSLDYVSKDVLKDKEPVLLRPIRAEDEPLLVQFHKDLSDKSIRQRYFEFVSFDARTAHERLLRICFSDFNREIALVAEVETEGCKTIGGVIRLIKAPGLNRWDLKLIISDRFQGKGMGKLLMKQILYVARQEKIEEIMAYVLEENNGMIALLQANGFDLKEKKKEQVLEFHKKLL